MISQALRLLETLRAIPREGKVSTTDLARKLEDAGFPINTRSVQRDLERLSQIYPLVSDTRSKPFGWQWAPGARAIVLPCLQRARAELAGDRAGGADGAARRGAANPDLRLVRQRRAATGN